MLETIVILALAFPIMSIVGLVMAGNTRERLRGLEFKLRTLDQRVATLIAHQGAAAATGEAPKDAPKEAPEAVSQLIPLADPVSTAAEPSQTRPLPSAAEPQPPVAIPASPTASPKSESPPGPSLEERFGTQWVVWVGGIAIAFGGFFLVRYSIEQGWFGPGMRVFLGALLALAVIAAGEWTHRNDSLKGIGGLPSAHIPSILTAAGTAVAYADVWAAYALYDFIGPAAAFFALGVEALATLAAALRPMFWGRSWPTGGPSSVPRASSSSSRRSCDRPIRASGPRSRAGTSGCAVRS